MKYCLLFFILIYAVSICKGQQILKELDLEKEELAYNMIYDTATGEFIVKTQHAQTKASHIHTQKGKFGPYSKVDDGYFAIRVKKPEGYYMFYRSNEYGPYDSIPEEGMVFVDSRHPTYLAFAIVENGKVFIINTLTNEKSGPFNFWFIPSYQFSENGKKLLYAIYDWDDSTRNWSYPCLYENDSLITCMDHDHYWFGYSPDGHLYYSKRQKENKSKLMVYFKGKTIEYDIKANGSHNLYRWPNTDMFEMGYFVFEKTEGNYCSKIITTDSGYYLLNESVLSGPIDYVEKSLRCSPDNKLFSFVTGKKKRYYLHFRDSIYGPFKQIPEMTFNPYGARPGATQWAYKYKRKRFWYVVMSTSRLGPFKSVDDIHVSQITYEYIFKGVKRNGNAFGYYKKRVYKLPNIETSFGTSRDGKSVLLKFKKGKTWYLGFNDTFFAVPYKMYVGRDQKSQVFRYGENFSWQTREFVYVVREKEQHCLYLNGVKKKCHEEITYSGVTKNGFVYYVYFEGGKEGAYYYNIRNTTFGPFRSIKEFYSEIHTQDGHDFFIANSKEGIFLLYEGQVLGNLVSGISPYEEFQFSESGLIAYKQEHDKGNYYVYADKHEFGPYKRVGDVLPTMEGLFYFATGERDSIVLMLNGVKLYPIGEDASQFNFGMRLRYHDEKRILSFPAKAEGNFRETIILNGKQYTGSLLGRRKFDGLIYLDGNKLMYMKL